MTWGKNWDSKVNVYINALSALRGEVSLPDHLKIAETCSRDHGRFGKTVRYKSDGRCLFCHREYKRKYFQNKAEKNCMVEIDHIAERRNRDTGDLW